MFGYIYDRFMIFIIIIGPENESRASSSRAATEGSFFIGTTTNQSSDQVDVFGTIQKSQWQSFNVLVH